jgi:hypothetical protein
MNASLIPFIIKERQREGNYKNHSVVFETWNFNGLETYEEYTSDLLFLVGSPLNLSISSDYGLYGQGGRDNHEHTGNLIISNQDTNARKIEFVRITWLD